MPVEIDNVSCLTVGELILQLSKFPPDTPVVRGAHSEDDDAWLAASKLKSSIMERQWPLFSFAPQRGGKKVVYVE